MSSKSTVALYEDSRITYKGQTICFLERTDPHSVRYYLQELEDITLEEKEELVSLILKYYSSLKDFFLVPHRAEDW